MHSTISTCLSVIGVAVTLTLAETALAEPEAPAEEESADESFAKSFLGKRYEGDLAVEGWTDFGGGLVSPPIWVHQYKRDDETTLVLTSRQTKPASGATPAAYVVTDALIISKPWKGYAISIACTQDEDFTLRFIGDARGPEEKEYWTEVRRAWEIEVETETDADGDAEPDAETETETESEPAIGKITKTNTKGVRCINPNW